MHGEHEHALSRARSAGRAASARPAQKRGADLRWRAEASDARGVVACLTVGDAEAVQFVGTVRRRRRGSRVPRSGRPPGRSPGTARRSAGTPRPCRISSPARVNTRCWRWRRAAVHEQRVGRRQRSRGARLAYGFSCAGCTGVQGTADDAEQGGHVIGTSPWASPGFVPWAPGVVPPELGARRARPGVGSWWCSRSDVADLGSAAVAFVVGQRSERVMRVPVALVARAAGRLGDRLVGVRGRLTDDERRARRGHRGSDAGGAARRAAAAEHGVGNAATSATPSRARAAGACPAGRP